MSEIAERTLRFALAEDRPVTVCYMGEKGISQRRVYVRKIENDKITVYCTQRRGLRVFYADRVLSAQLAEE